MDFKDQANSSIWISLINTVFASIAVLPVFLVWFLGIITDSIEEKENTGERERVIILDDTEEESNVGGEERHLYVIPTLRKDSNLLDYQHYCAYQDQPCQPGPDYNVPSEGDHGESKKIKTNSYKVDTDKNKNLVSAPFNWPADSDVIEHLRTFQNQNSGLSQEMKNKLDDIGILRRNPELAVSPVKIADQARLTGQTMTKKQVHVFWDNFQSKSRPGLHQGDSTPSNSPSPKSRKPRRKINLEKTNKLESRVKQKHFGRNQNHNLMRAM